MAEVQQLPPEATRSQNAPIRDKSDLQALQELISDNPQYIYSINKETCYTRLHDAVEKGQLETVELLLSTAEKHCPKDFTYQEWIDKRDEDDHTALHLTAFLPGRSIDIAKLLVKNKASLDPPSVHARPKSPFYKAVMNGKTELGLYLLEAGAIVHPASFQAIIRDGLERLAEAVVSSTQWPGKLTDAYTRHGKKTTAFRELIAKMPDVAKMVLDRCVVENWPKDDTSGATAEEDKENSREKNNYEVTFKYEFLEKQCGMDTFSKDDHPLKIMTSYNRTELLTHPVVGSLIHRKWMKFGVWCYFLNLALFSVYLLLLTTFVLLLPNPQSVHCVNRENGTAGDVDQNRDSIIGVSIFVLFFALGRFIFEAVQFVVQTSPIKFYNDYKSDLVRCSHLTTYLLDFINWIELAQYLTTIVFVSLVLSSVGFCAGRGAWQLGVAAVFFGWTVLIVFLSKFPIVGIYVIILVQICKTYLMMVILTILMIVTFALTFYLSFSDTRVERSPFGDPAITLLKTMTMSTGEVDFDGVFRLSPSGDSSDKDELLFPVISYLVWILFIFFMPVVLINMLTSLAVDDTENIRAEAQLHNLTLQVDQVLGIEEAYFKITKMCCTSPKCISCESYKFKPNETIRTWRKVWEDFSFLLWGGKHYGNRETVTKIFEPPKNEVLERVIAVEKDIALIKDYLKQILAGQSTASTGTPS